MYWLANTLFYPLRMASALSIIVFTAGFSLAAISWGVGVWLAVILLFAVVQYAFVLVDASARGQPEPPNLDAITLNPLYDRRPACLLLAGFVLWGVNGSVQRELGDGASYALIAAALVLAPAAIASMAATGRAASAVNVEYLIGVVVALGRYYLAALAGIGLITLAAISITAWDWPMPLRIAAWLYLYFLSAHLLGVMVYQGRDRVGFQPDKSPERDAEVEQARQLHARKACLSQIYETKAQSTDESLRRLHACAAQAPDPLVAEGWFFEQLISWPDAAMALAFGRPYIDHLMRLQQADVALEVCQACLALEPRFRPAQASDTIALAQTAERLNHYTVAAQLLSDFTTRFPQDPAAPAALLSHATLSFRPTGQPTAAFASMRLLLQRFPGSRENPQVMALARELREAHRPRA